MFIPHLLSGRPFSPEANALFARMTPPPTAARKTEIDRLIGALKTAGVWPKLDALYVLAAHSAQAARLNWKADIFNAIEVNSPTFTVDRGYNGNGTTSYLSTNFNPSTAGGLFTQNSAMFMVWNRTTGQIGTSAHGFFNGTDGITLNPRNTSDQIGARINQAAQSTYATNTNTGLIGAQRTTSTALEAFRNGASVNTASVASTALVNGALRLGSIQDGSFSTIQSSACVIGQSLSAGEHAALYSALQLYMSAVGVHAAETTALIARMSAAPSAARQALIDGLITGLKNAGLWTKLDALWLLAAHDSQAALLNWKSASFDASLSGTPTPTFTADRGFLTDGTQSYVSTGYNPTAAAGNFVQDSACFAIWSRTEGQLVNSAAGWVPVSGAACSIAPRNTATPDGFRVRVNCVSASGQAGSDNGRGLFSASRANATTQRGYRNGSPFLSVAQASTALVDGVFRLGSTGDSSFAPMDFAGAFAASDLTDAEQLAIYNLMNTYMTGVGAA